MSSLAPGHLLQGAKWGYRITDTIKGDNTHASSVFKARVVPRKNGPDTPKWLVGFQRLCLTQYFTLIHPSRAVIKKALPGDEIASENVERECRSYRLPGVASATCFRQLYDVIDNHTIALEWLDPTLADVKYQPDTHTYAIIKAVIREALTSCVILDRQQYVNTGNSSECNC